MRGFILEVIVFTLVSMFCFSVFGDDWRDEDMVWDEDKGEWVTVDKPRSEPQKKKDKIKDRANFNMGGNAGLGVGGTDWYKYLPRVVRMGERQPTDWEIEKAKRKMQAKKILQQRAKLKAQQRQQLIHQRKMSGWYGARRSGAHNNTLSWPMSVHVNSVRRVYGGY